MTASESDIARLRRMTDEPTSDTYTDEDLAVYLENWPLIDSHGRNYENTSWTAAYDLHAAAADIWEEKAAAVHTKHDFTADGATFSSNQMYDNAMRQSTHHRAQQKATTKRSVIIGSRRRPTYYPDYVNPIFDEDEPLDIDNWTDDITG